MSDEKTVVLKLKDNIINPDGTAAKDASSQDLSQQELLTIKPSQMQNWPNLTIGEILIRLINNRKPENIEDMSKLQRLLVKIRNKIQTGKGEWNIEKQELLDLQEVFSKSDPKTFNVNLHGQVYNKLQDLLVQLTSS